MSNPVLSNSPIFGEKADRDVQRSQDQLYGQAAAGTAAASTVALENLYASPAATATDTGRLTYDDVIMKTAGVFAVLVIAAAVAWPLARDYPAVWIAGMVGGLVLGLINSFKRSPSPALILLYAAFEGLFLGGISAAYNDAFDGIVLQAVLATFGTFAATLVLFRSGKIRVTPKFTRWLITAMVGYLVFSLLNLVLVMTGLMDGWGMRGGTLGIVIGLVAVGLAAASLLVDFDSIQRGVREGAPAKFAWTAAFGLIVTLVWLYLEFLRLLAILRD